MRSRKVRKRKSVISAPMRDDDNTLFLESSRLRISADKSDDYIATQLTSTVKTSYGFRRLEERLKAYLGEERFDSVKSLYEQKRNRLFVCAEKAGVSTPKMEALLQKEKRVHGERFVLLDVISCTPSRKGVQLSVNYEEKDYQLYIPEKMQIVPAQVGCVKTQNNLLVDEYWLYSTCGVFKVGRSYVFRVIRTRNNGCNWIVTLVDKCFNTQEVISDVKFKPDDQIRCKIVEIKRRKSHKLSLVLSDPVLYKKAPLEKKPKPKKNTQSKGYLHLIYTPMGNKR